MPVNQKYALVPAVIGMLLVLVGTAFGANEVVVLQVEGPAQGFRDLKLEDKLYYLFSGVSGLTPAWKADVDYWMNQKDRHARILYSSPIQQELGDRFNAEYLVWIKIKQAGTAVKSSTVVPFIFKSHKRKYVYEIDLRLIDAQSGSLIKSKRIIETKNGKRSLAYLDLDESSQPALASTYSDEMAVFEELENKIADKIVREFIKTHNKRR